MRTDNFDRIVREIYDAALDPDQFPEVAVRISDSVGGASVHLLLADLNNGIEYLSKLARGDDAFSREYVRDFLDQDFRVPRVLAQQRGVLIQETSYVSRQEYARSEIHQTLLPKYEIHNIVGANLGVGETTGWFGISTRCADTPFDADQLQFLSAIVPHLHQAYKILMTKAQLAQANSALGLALHAMDGPILVLQGSTVEFANAAAMQLFDEGFFHVKSGRLVCVNRSQSRRIAAFLSRPASPVDVSIVVRDPDMDVSYFLRCRDVPDASMPASPELVFRRIVTVGRTSRLNTIDPTEIALFCRQYGLSPRETAVVTAVLGEVPLRDFADAERIALNTAQKQLKAALAKLDLPSQKALFRAYERFRLLGGVRS